MEQDRVDLPRLTAKMNEVLTSLVTTPLAPQLYLVATPIGHLGDISLRALATLARVDKLAVEDTRRSGTLLQHFGLSTPMMAYHDHNGAQMRPQIVSFIKEGHSVALISDAGTPLISDPGYKLAKEVRAAGLEVEVVPGPSAVMAGLSLSGLPTDRFLFEGFLPPKQQARRRQLEALQGINASLVFFETVKRIPAVLQDMVEVLGDRPVALCRELTKMHQEVIEGTMLEVLAVLKERDLKGELVVIVGPPERGEVSDEEIERALEAHVANGASMKDSVGLVVEAMDVPKRRVYDLSVGLKKRLEGSA